MRPPKQSFVYIMTNGPKPAVLYTGITGNLVRHIWQHKNKLTPGFTSRYNLTQLAYYEPFFYPDAAITREKEIKGWRRGKKIKLIESMNPRWGGLGKGLGQRVQACPRSNRARGDPSPRWRKRGSSG